MKTLLLTFLCLVAATACGNSKMRSMSNGELIAKNDECLRVNPTSPGMVTACENIRKECERRRTEGNYAC